MVIDSRKSIFNKQLNRYSHVLILIAVISCFPGSPVKHGAVSSNIDYNVCDSISSVIRRDIFKESIRSARIENKKVFLLFSFKGCAICKIFEKYHNDPLVHKILSEHLIITEIDINKTPGGGQLYSIYGKPGFPSWTILDSAKTIIADSGNLEYGNGNIGFPYNNDTRDHYINALKKATPSLSYSECIVLIKKLRYYRTDKKQ
jgi:hypothetical protein